MKQEGLKARLQRELLLKMIEGKMPVSNKGIENLTENLIKRAEESDNVCCSFGEALDAFSYFYMAPASQRNYDFGIKAGSKDVYLTITPREERPSRKN